MCIRPASVSEYLHNSWEIQEKSSHTRRAHYSLTHVLLLNLIKIALHNINYPADTRQANDN